MNQWLYRMQARWRLMRNFGRHLNRRAEVEQVLLDVANKKRPTLTCEESRQLALKLGMHE